MKPTAAAYHDTRYTKEKSNSYPVRIRITFDQGKNKKGTTKYVHKYLPTDYSLTKSQWKRMKGSKPGELKETELEIKAIESKAAGIIKKLRPFSFEAFLKKFNGTSSDEGIIKNAFDEYIKTLYKNDQVGTAIAYESAKRSIEAFNPGLTFDDITTEKLRQYENWMKTKGCQKIGKDKIKIEKGNSTTTIGMYLRCLRSLFNTAIIEGNIPADIYPFGKKRQGKYTIRKGMGRKTALPLSELAKIYNYKAEPGSITEKAKDFFIFMYLGNGINIKDVCLLKYKNIEGDFIIYNRQKTIRTKDEEEEIRVHLKPEMKTIIKKWGNRNDSENYVFPILTPGLSAEQIHVKKNNLISTINKNLKIIAADIGIDKNITTYVARHSFATVLKRSGASIEMISETLGHRDLKTTKNYLADFEDAALIEATDKPTDFKKGITSRKAKIVNL